MLYFHISGAIYKLKQLLTFRVELGKFPVGKFQEISAVEIQEICSNLASAILCYVNIVTYLSCVSRQPIYIVASGPHVRVCVCC